MNPFADPAARAAVEELLVRALALPAAERERCLRAAPVGEPVREEVRSLLAASDRAGAFLETPAFALVDGAEPAAPPEAGRRIGSCHLLRLLAAGGMGLVYEAEQADPPRTVAVKIMRGGALLGAARQRLFRREVELLARLQHPGIAAIYEAGVTEDGLHYFVMELVRGEPLDVWLAHALAARAVRLRWFLEVCAAVEHAHAHGVLHCDLKPGNLLVVPAAGGGPPAAKVLDFGLARLLEPEAAAASVQESGRLIGTLAYMSPEQAAGPARAIDRRSDVYALGVILYELLAGRRPLELADATLHAALQAVAYEVPPRLGELDPRLRGDLEAIAAQALAKDPARRYPSVAALAEDLRRHLEGRPVRARPPSRLYELRKLAARHRGLFAGVALSFVLLAGAFGLALGQAQRARRAEAEALAGRDLARASDEFLQGLLEAGNPWAGAGELGVDELLDRAAIRAGHELADRPLLLAGVKRALGRVYGGRGQPARAAAELEDALRLARAHDAPAYLLAAILYDRGAQRLHSGAIAAAEADLRAAHALRAAEPKTLRSAIDLAFTEEYLAAAVRAAGRPEEALPLARSAVARLRAADPRAPELGTLLSTLAGTQAALGQFAAARASYTEALAVLAERHGDPLIVAGVQHNLAALLVRAGEHAAAVEPQRAVLALYRERLGEKHPDVARVGNLLGVALQGAGRAAEAEEVLRAALVVQREHGNSVDLATTLGNLALALAALERPGEAEEACREALGLRTGALGPGHPDLANTQHQLASLLRARGAHEEALELLQAAAAALEAAFRAPHPRTAAALEDLSRQLAAVGRKTAAAEPLRRAAAKYQALGDAPAVARCRSELELLAVE